MRRLSWVLALIVASPAGAQTLTLEEIDSAAIAHDPRMGQYGLLRSATELRLENIAAERLPQVSLRGEAAYYSDVTSLPISLPGASIPMPPKDRWEAALGVNQVLYDGGGIRARRDVERARTREQEAELSARLYAIREEAERAFFSALLAEARIREWALLEEDLEARRAEAGVRLREGVATPAEAAAVQAELLRARQSGAEIRASRDAALAVLEELTGLEIPSAGVLEPPDLAEQVMGARRGAGAGRLRRRPEFERFEASARRLEEEAELVKIERRPRAVAFGQAGYGRPGLDQFRADPQTFWTVGVRVEWAPFAWETRERRQELIELQRRILATEEAAFADRLQRSVQDQLATMDRLQEALSTDREIVELRQAVEAEARERLREGEITAAAYVDARTDLLEARLALERHRLELAQARATYLATLGMEYPDDSDDPVS